MIISQTLRAPFHIDTYFLFKISDQNRVACDLAACEHELFAIGRRGVPPRLFGAGPRLNVELRDVEPSPARQSAWQAHTAARYHHPGRSSSSGRTHGRTVGTVSSS